MNKKADITLWQVLVGVIVFLLVFVPTANFVVKFFRSTSVEEQTFGQLIKKIDSISSGNIPADTVKITLNKDAGIVAFGKNADKITIEYYAQGVGASVPVKTKVEFNRPPSCSQGSFCLCLCKKGFSTATKFCDDKELVCSEPESDVDLPKFIETSLFRVSLGDKFDNGFILANSMIPENQQQTVWSLLVEKGKSKTIGICIPDQKDCLKSYEDLLNKGCSDKKVDDCFNAPQGCIPDTVTVEGTTRTFKGCISCYTSDTNSCSELDDDFCAYIDNNPTVPKACGLSCKYMASRAEGDRCVTDCKTKYSDYVSCRADPVCQWNGRPTEGPCEQKP